MRIGLDFDGTITRDPILWQQFVALAKQAGHEVTIVTLRQPAAYGGNENNDIKRFAEACGIDVVFTAGQQKADCFKADVWIDDMPVLIPSEVDLWSDI